ncbi:toll/interleukin-1 receptor domain-containing protein [Streptomyces viridochromogenes]|uniref:TIR domain-containing protein n=1 Tax=Streptomyces viridochromogenes Tue57 TaxID=1160705 RepID=L8PCL6_STRVR|nr:toll/interleukin-1 receptor domain-containing protein [Streptomyces viridochromogenes]ELS53944.1 hypothetical protein STVIR_5108 [Streptomyces viridochromogenes Tue57]
MGGIFINYRRGDHEDVVRELYDRLEQHFGEDQVFRAVASIVPGQRYPDTLRARVADCEVLLVVIHEGWTDTRDESGTRRLDRPDDWVRQEIEQALGAGRTVIPLLLDDAEPPKPAELPSDARDLAHRQAQRLRVRRFRHDLNELVAVLESRVAPTWRPVPAPPQRAVPGGGRWPAAGTAVLAAGILLGVPAIDWGDGWVTADDLPFPLYAASWSLLLMSAPLVSVGVVHGPLCRRIDAWERELHKVKYRTYLGQTWPVALAVALVSVIGGLSTQGEAGALASWGVVLCAMLGVARGTATLIRLQRRDRDLWTRWPQELPDRVSRQELRRAVVRLEVRMSGWSRPLSREQREKAAWELAEIGRASGRMAREAARARMGWLVQDHPVRLGCYVLWLTLTAALFLAAGPAYRAAGLGTVRLYAAMAVAVLIGAAMSLGTMEISYRRQRRTRTELVREVAERTCLLAGRLTDLSSPARTRPSAPAPRPEEFAEPD